MYYVYFIQSIKDNKFYIGCSSREPRMRLDEHNRKMVASTKNRIPFKLVYYEKYTDKNSAFKREWYLKHPKGYKDKIRIIQKIMGL